MRYQVLAAAAVGTCLLSVLVYCSPTAPIIDAGDSGICDDSGANCPCDLSKVRAPVDCYTGTRGTNGRGACVTGKRTCTANATWTACVGEVIPSPEVCDFKDNDCNGIVDDVQGSGLLLPDAGGLAPVDTCQSPSCDLNPLNSDAGITCYSGIARNACKSGQLVCGPPPTGFACQPFQGIYPTPELCNGWDDDCNDQVDDNTTDVGKCDVDPEAGVNFPDGAVATGECVHSTSTCADSGLYCPPSDPAAEKCDGKDNDCNGIVDDHACAGNLSNPLCCHSGSFYLCATSIYTTFGYTCVNAL